MNILLYSMYSDECDRLRKHIDPNDYHCVPIDNHAVRKKILESKTLVVSEVPCIITIGDEVCVYEGDEAFHHIGIHPSEEEVEEEVEVVEEDTSMEAIIARTIAEREAMEPVDKRAEALANASSASHGAESTPL